MFKYFVVVVVFGLKFNLYAQEEVAILPIKFESLFYSKKESLAVSNSENGNLLVLVEDVDKTNYFLLDEKLMITGRIQGEKLNRKFKNFLGYSIEGNSYNIFFSNNSHKKFGRIQIDFSQKIAKEIFFEFDLGKDKYLTSVSNKNDFYIVTGKKNANDVHFHKYVEGDFSKKHISFDLFQYTNLSGFKNYAFKCLKEIQVIDSNSPNPIELTSKKTKLYQVKDTLMFTDDRDIEKTKVILVNTSNFDVEEKIFEKTRIKQEIDFEGEIHNNSHNSYYYNGVLYQVCLNSKKMNFKAKLFSSKAVLKELVLEKEDSITFKNGPIIQEGAPNPMFSDRVRKLEKTSKFLRKSHLGETGLSASLIDDKIQIQIGSYKEIKGGGAAMGMPGFGAIPIASFGAISLTFNPMAAAYGSHSSSKSTHISCVFDTDFNHIKGEPLETIFDKIEFFEDSLGENIKEESEKETKGNLGMVDNDLDIDIEVIQLKNIFFHNGNHYLGYLNVVDKDYHLIKF